MSVLTAPVYRSISEQIVEQLRLEIMTGAIGEGTPLREQEVSARFGVSRGPVRDALLRLGQDGLVNARPNAGATVAARPNESIRALITDIRSRIEGFALSNTFAADGESVCSGWSSGSVRCWGRFAAPARLAACAT